MPSLTPHLVEACTCSSKPGRTPGSGPSARGSTQVSRPLAGRVTPGRGPLPDRSRLGRAVSVPTRGRNVRRGPSVGGGRDGAEWPYRPRRFPAHTPPGAPRLPPIGGLLLHGVLPMDLLRRLFGGREAAGPGRGAKFALAAGPDDLEVVGESHYQDALRALFKPPEGRSRMEVNAILLAEAHNPYDPNAVSVWIEGRKVGHLSRDDAAAMRPGLLRLQEHAGTWIALPGVIVAGGPVGTMGVFLNWDPSAFGLEDDALSAVFDGSTIRTGLRFAARSDAYGSELSELTEQETRTPQEAVEVISRQLELEHREVARHFLYAELEGQLYAWREQPGALDLFDATCERHDSEMPQMRAALCAEFGDLPRLQVYHQAAIRHQKAHDWSAALRWAERGLVVYGQDALNGDKVEDLRRKAANYKVKLNAEVPLGPSGARSDTADFDARPEDETLICAVCGGPFVRRRTRGRKPTRCPVCLGLRQGIEHPADKPQLSGLP